MATTPPPPQPCDLLIAGGTVLDPGDPERAAAGVDTAVAIADGVIVAVGPRAAVEAAWAPARRIDAGGHVVVPGFVDAHVHVAAFMGAGRPYVPATAPGPFSGAGDTAAILPMVARWCTMPVPAEITAPVARAGLAAMLRSGFTGVVDAGGPGVEGVWEAAADVGIRAAVGPSVADQWHDDAGDLVRQADAGEVLQAAEEFVDPRDRPGGRQRPLVSAVEVMACSDELLAGIADLAKRRDLPTHVHSHIDEAGNRAHVEAFGRTPTERLSAAGLLDEHCTIMHAGALSDDDVRAFAAAGVTVNHNPVGNALHGFGVAGGRSVPRLLAAGVPVVLGSDYAPSVTSPFEQVRAALMLHREVAASDFGLTLEAALAMAWSGATPLGRPGELGRIAPGHLADLVLVDVTGAHHLASTHPVPAVALHARAGDVATVVVGGDVVVEGGRLVALDEAELLAEARTALEVVAAHSG
jgi:5-methylthioadenosine/S-adenosylhomocysteine deaminase